MVRAFLKLDTEMSLARAMCVSCSGLGSIWPVSSSTTNKYWKTLCPVCAGTARDTIPWAELFKDMRKSPVQHDQDWKPGR